MVTDHHDTIGFQRFNGRIPWTDIAEHPSDHLASKSRPDSDCKLEEPSHMKSESVDCWLTHWLQIQDRGRRPLVVKDPTKISSQPHPKPKIVSKQKVKRSGAQDTDNHDPDDSNGQEHSEKLAKGAMMDGDESQGTVSPASPLSASDNRNTRREFLKSLSSDTNYLNLLHVLDHTRVSREVLLSSSFDTCPG
jgi:hypothetical protein